MHATSLGLDLIITDHHEPEHALPPALAVINPKRHDCSYPDKNLAGVGVALKLVQALCARAGREAWLPAFVKVAAIGTLADVVPLTGENRVIAKLGLGMLSKGPHKVGLRALLDVCGLTGKEIDSYHIGFVLAPRVNAAGRMSTPDIAARLLLAADEAMAAEARELAERLVPLGAGLELVGVERALAGEAGGLEQRREVARPLGRRFGLGLRYLEYALQRFSEQRSRLGRGDQLGERDPLAEVLAQLRVQRRAP